MNQLMRRRQLGRIEITVSEIGLGTWGLSGDGYGEVSEATQDAVIDRARSLGITLFETADVYAKGKMEAKLGERLAGDEEVVIVTKLGTDLESTPSRKRFDVAYLEQAFAKSQERLRRDVMDVVLLHNPSFDAVKHGDACAWLQDQVEAGRLRAWGVSAGDKIVARAALGLERFPHVIELAHNVFCSEDVRELDFQLKQRNVALLARSVLAHGLLAGLWPVDKTFPPEDHRSQRWTGDQLRRRIHQLKAMRALNTGPSIPSMRAGAIGYVLRNQRVSSAVLGPRSVLQLDQLVRETPREPPYLDERARQQLEVQLRRLGVHG